VSDFQTWAQSIDPKVWSKNDLHYSKLAWDEGRKELEAAVRKHKAEIHEKMSFKKFPSHCIEDMKLWKVIE
tara:strand:+ start:144 stop:356 length:213 start_codon:yes stop_codon:yes gene_type:complete